MARNSAAYFILVIAVAFLVVGFVFTMLSQPWSAVLDSQLTNFDTSYGQNLATWTQDLYDWIMLVGSLIAILFYALVRSRQATP